MSKRRFFVFAGIFVAVGAVLVLALFVGGSPVPMPRLELAADDQVRARVVNGCASGVDRCVIRSAMEPFSRWAAIYDGAGGDSWIHVGNRSESLAVQAEFVDELGGRTVGPVRFSGRFAGNQAFGEVRESLLPLPDLPITVDLGSGRYRVRIALPGSDVWLTHISASDADLVGIGRGWVYSFAYHLIGTEPPCVLDDEGNLIALQWSGGRPGERAASADGSIVATFDRERGATETLVRGPGSTTRYSVGAWGAGGMHRASEIIRLGGGSGAAQRVRVGAELGANGRRIEVLERTGRERISFSRGEASGAVEQIGVQGGAEWKVTLGDLEGSPGVQLLRAISTALGEQLVAFAFEYDEAGRLIAITTPGSLKTVIETDKTGRLVGVRGPATLRQTLRYEEDAQRVWHDRGGKVTLYGRVETRTFVPLDPDGAPQVYREYDDSGRIVLERTRYETQMTTYFEDGSKKVVRVRRGPGHGH